MSWQDRYKYNRQLFLTVATVIAVSISIFYLTITWPDKSVGFLSDDAVYLLLAEIYSPWYDNILPMHGYLLEFNYYPPLFPLVMGLFGVDSSVPELAALINLTFYLAGALLVAFWLYKDTEKSLLSLLVPIIYVFLPASIIFTQELWSEFLYIFLSFLFFLVLAYSKTPGSTTALLAGIIICFAMLTRSIAIALYIPFIIFLIKNRPGSWLGSIAVSILPYLAWFLLNQTNSSSESYFTLAINYMLGLQASEYADLVVSRLTIYWQSWCWLFTLQSEYNNSLTRILLCLLMLLLWVGFIVRLIAGKPDSYYFATYTVIILVWPYSDTHFLGRFHFPLLPLYLLYIFLGVQFLLQRFESRLLVSVVSVIIIAVVAAPVTYQLIGRAYAPISAELSPYKRGREWLLAHDLEQARRVVSKKKQTIDQLRAITNKIPLTECLYAAQAPLILLYTKRITGVFPAATVDDEVFFEQTQACRFFLAMDFVDHRGDFPALYPFHKLKDEQRFSKEPYYIIENNQKKINMYLITRLY